MSVLDAIRTKNNYFKISSASSSTSSLTLKSKESSSDRTSLLIENAYKTQEDVGLSNLTLGIAIKKKSLSDISFTSWEKEFLNREIYDIDDQRKSDLSSPCLSEDNQSKQNVLELQPIPSSTHEVSPIQHEKGVSDSFMWLPVSKDGKIPNSKPKRSYGGFKALKEIVNRQRKLFEESHQSANTSVQNLKVQSHDNFNTEEIENICGPTAHEDEECIYLPPTRKKCFVSTYPSYKGFSMPSARYKKRNIKKTVVNIKEAKELPAAITQNRAKKRVKIKRRESKELELTEESKATKNPNNGASTTNGYENTSSSSFTKSSNTLQLHTSNAKSEEKQPENEKTELHEQQETKTISGTKLSDSDSDESSSISDLKIDSEKVKEFINQVLPKRSVKRKAFTTPEEKFSPSPKVRHYDADAVREYIQKKKAERKLRHQDEHRKKLHATQKKKESLQKLLDYQKAKLMLQASKPTLPIKDPPPWVDLTDHPPTAVDNIMYNSVDHCIKASLKQSKISNQNLITSQKSDISIIPARTHEMCKSPVKPQKIQKVNKTIKSPVISNETTESHVKSNEVTSKNVLLDDIEMDSKAIQTESTSQRHESDRSLPISEIEMAHRQTEELNSLDKSHIQRQIEYLDLVKVQLCQSPSSGSPDQVSNRMPMEDNFISSDNLREAQNLKNLVRSINKMYAPLEPLLRTKNWIEQNPLPPQCKSQLSESAEISPPQPLDRPTDLNFIVHVTESLEPEVTTSFRQKIKDIGDTSQFMEKIFCSDSVLSKSEVIVSLDRSAENTSDDDESGLIEGSLHSDDEVNLQNEFSPTKFKNENDSNLQLDNYHHTRSEIFAPNKIDPFNFINTWNRKPLGITLSTEGMSKDLLLDHFSAKEEISTSQGITNSSIPTVIDDYSSSFTLQSSTSIFDDSSVLNNESKSSVIDGKPLASKDSTLLSDISSLPVSTHVSTLSVPMKRSDQESVKEILETGAEQSIREDSGSSASEGISVIENSLQKSIKSLSTSTNSTPIDKNLLSKSKNSSPEKYANTHSVEGSSIKVNKEAGITLSDQYSSEIEENDIPEEFSLEDEIEEKSIVDEDMPANNDSLSKTPENDKTLTSAQKYNSIHKSLPLHEEQYLHTQIVTRVASEAAAAAATSAVIAVFEAQKELLNRKPETVFQANQISSGELSSQSRKSLSVQSLENSSVSTLLKSGHSSSVSEITHLEGEYTSPSSSTVKEGSKELEQEHSIPTSLSNKSSAEISDLSVGKKSFVSSLKFRGRKISGNVSSLSPASLSENDSLSHDVSLSSSSPSLVESVHSGDSFAQLTLDVVRRITQEEELRASQQLAFLKFQERTLVENARVEMTWLESLKKMLREKGANKKASFIKQKQKDLILRLRQERAQLKCMQEGYRSICQKHHSLPSVKRKLFNDKDIETEKREKFHIPKQPSTSKAKYLREISTSSTSTSTYEEEKVEEQIKSEIAKSSKELASSQGSIVEAVPSESVKSSSSHSKSRTNSVLSSFPQAAQNLSHSNQSLNSNNSGDAPFVGLKKIESSKRHLTKREQRIFQRRKDVERLLQWQMKLDSEEMAVRELEQKAVQLVDSSKKKSKYYISSSPSTAPNDEEEIKRFETSEIQVALEVNSSNDSHDTVLPDGSVPESLQSGSILEENNAVLKSGNSTEKPSREGSNVPEVLSGMSSSSIQEIASSPRLDESQKTAEINTENSQTEEVPTTLNFDKRSVISKQPSSPDTYSESFESTLSTRSNVSHFKNSSPLNSSTKEQSINIKSPLTPRSLKRHNSSGSDDSYTVSHSETASDQSDIEVRIHALSAELRRRRHEADKLKREQKRKYKEHLKGTEISLQKQVEAYDNYIQQVKSELEKIEAISSQPQSVEVPTARPQIKWPRPERVTESRRMRTQFPEAKTPEKKLIKSIISNPESADVSASLLHKGTIILRKRSEVDEPKHLENDSKQSSNKIEPSEQDTSQHFSFVTETSSANEIEEKSRSEIEVELKDTFDLLTSSVTTDIDLPEKDSRANSLEHSSYPDSFASVSTSTEKSNDASQVKVSVKTSDEISSAGSSLEYSEDTKTSAPTESSRSSEIECSESSQNASPGSIKEEVESCDFENNNSSGYSLHSTSKYENDTFIVHNETYTVEYTEVDAKSSLESKLKENLKSETFIVNMVNFLYSSLLDDAIKSVLHLSQKGAIYLKKSKKVNSEMCVPRFKKSLPTSSAIPSIPEEDYDTEDNRTTFVDSKGVSHLVPKTLSESVTRKVSNELLERFLQDAISSFMSITNHFKNGSGADSAVVNCMPQDSLFNVEKPTTNDKNFCSNDMPVQDKTDSIFYKQIDWYEDSFVTSQWDSQLEQQIVLNQYPYFFRKIPNKPPPPYTPPTSMNAKSLQLTIKKEKPDDTTYSIKVLTENINLLVDRMVDVYLKGKRSGLMLKEVPKPNFGDIVKQINLIHPHQLMFLNFIWDLSKEILIDLFREKEETPTPWLRPIKLTPRPIFPMDDKTLASVLLSELQKALKLTIKDNPGNISKSVSWAELKRGRRKRDFVDTVLLADLTEEEPEWLNYGQDENAIKFDIADSILDLLVDDTVNLLQNYGTRFHAAFF